MSLTNTRVNTLTVTPGSNPYAYMLPVLTAPAGCCQDTGEIQSTEQMAEKAFNWIWVS